ncbi:MAG: ribose 5-phosphate isomerase B [Bacteroidota bacterium]
MIALASDHAGYQYKERIKQLLDSLHESHEDFGATSSEPSDYPDYAHAAAEAVSRGECDRGILVCGSGIGMDIVANKSKGVRAALCTSVEMARVSRSHNDANVLVLGERITDWPTVEQIVKTWLQTKFEGGRHDRRVKKIHSLTDL